MNFVMKQINRPLLDKIRSYKQVRTVRMVWKVIASLLMTGKLATSNKLGLNLITLAYSYCPIT